jgi:uncharacterized protein (DUF362 family)
MKRRKFLGSGLISLAGLFAFGAADSFLSRRAGRILSQRFANPFLSGEKPVLIVVRGTDLPSMVNKGMALLFETANRALPMRSIFIKPNATWPEPYPVTTHPEILWEIVRFFHAPGERMISVGDNPSLRGIAVRTLFRKLGYAELTDTWGARILPRNPSQGSSYREVRNNAWTSNPAVMINKDILAADLVVNTAIPKRHHEADFTCALKNCFGAVYDPFRTLAHLRMIRDPERGEEFFDRTIAECADASRPLVNIIDARTLLTVSGPGFYSGGIVKGGVHELIFSGDMVLTDAYCGELMRQNDPSFRPERRLERLLRFAEELGLGTSDPSRAEIVEIDL